MSAPEVEARPLGSRERAGARARLRAGTPPNLLLLDLVDRLDEPPPPAEPAPVVMGLWRGRTLAGVGSLRPCVMLDDAADDAVLAAFLPLLEPLGSGLVKTGEHAGERIARELARLGRHVLVDRRETVLVRASPPPPPPAVSSGHARAARRDDHAALVEAARASLREEGRPDPFDTDPEGFRRWVAGRMARALVVEDAGRVAFVGYADVRRREGWLLQGVYTWPAFRRRGLARHGVARLCGEAAQGGGAHVQLTVVEGNAAAEGLYAGLGFAPAGRVRTLLFAPR